MNQNSSSKYLFTSVPGIGEESLGRKGRGRVGLSEALNVKPKLRVNFSIENV